MRSSARDMWICGYVDPLRIPLFLVAIVVLDRGHGYVAFGVHASGLVKLTPPAT